MAYTIDDLMKLLEELDRLNAYYNLRRTRDDAISIDIATPGARWEIDFLPNERIDVEIFRSDGEMYDESKLVEFFKVLKE